MHKPKFPTDLPDGISWGNRLDYGAGVSLPLVDRLRLALELDGRDARGSGAHQVGRPEPQVQRCPGAVQDRAGGQGDLIAAG